MEKERDKDSRGISLLVTSVLIISVCAITYELLISSISSYLLGSSILHFSLTIGLFMSFMGVGSYLSKFVTEHLIDRFVLIEIIIGLVGGLSAFLLYLSFSLTEYYYIVALLLIGVISTLAGLEIPIVLRIVKEHSSLKDAVANVLAVDYIGALIASILFPLVLLPYLGIMRTSFLVGVLNIVIALICIAQFKDELVHRHRNILLSLCSAALLCVGFIYSFSLVGFFEKFIYQDKIIFAAQTPYQRMVITKFKNDVRLFLNGSIQFSSADEYRYHEPLVHVPLSLVRHKEHILILGGGDGLAAREILKYPEVQQISVVDIDAKMTSLARENPLFTTLNSHALSDERVTVVNKDAFAYVKNTAERFSAVIIDLPDPNDPTLGRLYSKEFYEMLKNRLTADGIVVTQSSSPYFARTAFWSINHTLADVFAFVVPYSTYVPSFGLWGFNMAANHRLRPEKIRVRPETRYLTAKVLPQLFTFDSDTADVPAEVNRLDNQVLVQYYEESWHDWN